MRSLTLALLAALVLVVVPSLGRADEPPAKPPVTEKSKEEPAKADLALPSKAYTVLRTAASKLPWAKRSAHMKQGAEMYLLQWKGAGKKAEGDEHYHLGMLLQSAELWADAARSFQATCASKGIDPSIANDAAYAEARLYANSKARAAIGTEPAAQALPRLLEHAASISDESMRAKRGSIEVTVASALSSMGKTQEAHDLRMATAQRDPLMAASVYRALVRDLLGRSHAMDGYEGMRRDAEPVMAMLKTQQAKAVELTEAKAEKALATLREAKPDAVDENGNLTNKNRGSYSQLEKVAYNAKRQVSRAKSLLTRLDGMDKPFTMLGKDVPAWTLEHAFSGIEAMEDLKGKVVVMDFWATWCPWCIKSFPAIRQLLKEYGEKGLVFVGVTASASSVYAARYDLDDDLKHKATPGERPKPAARLARGSQKPDGETVFGPEEFPAKEREVITTFIKNHEMTWPVVMIDKTEPGPKYALGGWPHAVVVDRAGRVRYFKSGALLLDRKEAYAKFKKVLDDLLSEKAP